MTLVERSEYPPQSISRRASKGQNRGNHVLTVREYYEKSVANLHKIRFINYNSSAQ